MMFKYLCYKFVQNQTRFISHNSKPKNHYNSLGISSTSTQNEVKSAYYKLSMIYHPDKNQNNPESSQKFRDINEAYEVLGNVRTRKLYDKGFYVQHLPVSDDIDKFYRSRETRSRPPPPTGRTPIYDFDEWSKTHYGATFRQTMQRKKKLELHKMKLENDADEAKMEKMLLAIGIATVLCMYILRPDSTDYDNVKYYGSDVSPRKKTVKQNTEKDL